MAYLAVATKRFGWSITAWVLMTNHFHLVIQTPDPNLSKGMQWLNGKYAGWFNRQYKRSGHLFQGRFKSFLIDKETYFTEVQRYVALNPVRAAMCSRPEDYAWSSYRMTVGLDEVADCLDLDAALALFGVDRESAQNQFREFVEAKIGSTERLWDKVTNGVFLGSEAWTVLMRKEVETKLRSSDCPKIQRAVGRPGMDKVIAAVACATGESEEGIRLGAKGSLRRLAAWIGWNEGWLTLRSIAASFVLTSEGHISALIRRCEREFESDAILLRQLDDSLALLRRWPRQA